MSDVFALIVHILLVQIGSITRSKESQIREVICVEGLKLRPLLQQAIADLNSLELCLSLLVEF